MPTNALAQLTANTPLRIAVTGVGGAGKSTLVEHLRQHAHAITQSPHPHQVRSRPRNPVLARLVASPFVPVLSRLAAALHHVATFLVPPAPVCVVHRFVPAPGRPDVTLWDAHGQLGVYALKHLAVDVDLVLFVTRLDHHRADRTDPILLNTLVRVFGKQVLDRLVIVLTHASALPPVNLTYRQFVRARSDLLASYVRIVWPPVNVSTTRRQHPSNPSAPDDSASDDAPLFESRPILNASASHGDLDHIQLFAGDRRKLAFWKRLSRHHQQNDQQPQQPQPPQPSPNPATKAVLAALANDNDTDEGSVTAIPEDFVDAIYEAGVHPDDHRVFADPSTPPIVMVELSQSCPRNEQGESVLPDGTAWLPKLVSVISETAKDAPQKAQQRRDCQQLALRPPPMKFSSRLRDMLTSLSRDGLRILLVEVAIVVLAWQIGAAIEHAQEREEIARSQQDSDSTLYELTEKEFERLTKPDPGSGGNAVLDFDYPDDIDWDETEEEFLKGGDPELRKEREKARSTPIPPLPFPFGTQRLPIFDNEIPGEGVAEKSPDKADAGADKEDQKKAVPDKTTPEKSTSGSENTGPKSSSSSSDNDPRAGANGKRNGRSRGGGSDADSFFRDDIPLRPNPSRTREREGGVKTEEKTGSSRPGAKSSESAKDDDERVSREQSPKTDSRNGEGEERKEDEPSNGIKESDGMNQRGVEPGSDQQDAARKDEEAQSGESVGSDQDVGGSHKAGRGRSAEQRASPRQGKGGPRGLFHLFRR